jgi:hypothetical protein
VDRVDVIDDEGQHHPTVDFRTFAALRLSSRGRADDIVREK